MFSVCVVRCLRTGCGGVADARRAARAEARGCALRDDDRHDAALSAAALQLSLLRGALPSKSSASASTQPANAQRTGHTDNSQSDPSLSSRDAYIVAADGRRRHARHARRVRDARAPPAALLRQPQHAIDAGVCFHSVVRWQPQLQRKVPASACSALWARARR